ncbi:hypothetical protein QN277_010545 [Acacia crassicarpa]|uniref:Uncharacterized protein n=1 Tax=Acacia crassicarpa TaxID=499986 RepID=A0AAE1INH2_9FABA|nr:hypothetical protein QN277_010545 [Acacia crassicarpa]
MGEPRADPGIATPAEGEGNGKVPDSCPEWIVEIQMTLGCVNMNEVKTCSICRVSEKIREAEAKAKDKGSYNYRPKCVAIGPIHRGTRSDLQIMEETKWRYMDKLLSRPTEQEQTETVKICSEKIRKMESIIRASYTEKIEMASEELTRNMLLDACFLLELLIRLSENTKTDPSDLDHIINDKKKMVRVLTDLTLLENQIPFHLLTVLTSKLLGDSKEQELATLLELSDKKRFSPQKLVKSLFDECDISGAGPDLSKGVYHFLHLIHLCYPDPYPQQHRHSKAPRQLLRCARKLQAFGITIRASQTNHSRGNNKTGILAAALTEFVDKFEFKIEFNETQRELTIPTLHIKEATEVKWRNLIAWEQLGLIGVGYKFSSYAYFFKSLVSSVHDIQLLKEKGVIRVEREEAKDEDLVIMFQSIISGEEQKDGRYREVCKGLNKAKVNGVVGSCVLIFRMVWHYLRKFLEWLHRGLISSLLSFVDTYLGTPWKFLGVVSGAALLALGILQTVYAIRAAKK